LESGIGYKEAGDNASIVLNEQATARLPVKRTNIYLLGLSITGIQRGDTLIFVLDEQPLNRLPLEKSIIYLSGLIITEIWWGDRQPIVLKNNRWVVSPLKNQLFICLELLRLKQSKETMLLLFLLNSHPFVSL
jgi:hypothetical protein